jgi:hypothetical protein
MKVPTKGQQIAAQDMEGRDLPKAEKGPSGRYKRETVTVSTRLELDKRNALEAHFRGIGLDLSSGIRTVLYEYARSNRLK